MAFTLDLNLESSSYGPRLHTLKGRTAIRLFLTRQRDETTTFRGDVRTSEAPMEAFLVGLLVVICAGLYLLQVLLQSVVRVIGLRRDELLATDGQMSSYIRAFEPR